MGKTASKQAEYPFRILLSCGKKKEPPVETGRC
jgi:hypothetical protein